MLDEKIVIFEIQFVREVNQNIADMNSPVFLKGEHIIDGLAGVPLRESKRIIELKHELFNADNTPKFDADKDADKTSVEFLELMFEFLGLMKKRTILWRAKLN